MSLLGLIPLILLTGGKPLIFKMGPRLARKNSAGRLGIGRAAPRADSSADARSPLFRCGKTQKNIGLPSEGWPLHGC